MMEPRGRKSAASQAIVAEDTLPAYLPAPDHLPPGQRKIWEDVVRTKPADWFKEDSAPLLEAYCSAVVHYRALSRRLDKLPTDVKDLSMLTRIVDQQARLVIALATKMRLTQQARYITQTAGRLDRDATPNKPWDED